MFIFYTVWCHECACVCVRVVSLKTYAHILSDMVAAFCRASFGLCVFGYSIVHSSDESYAYVSRQFVLVCVFGCAPVMCLYGIVQIW